MVEIHAPRVRRKGVETWSLSAIGANHRLGFGKKTLPHADRVQMLVKRASVKCQREIVLVMDECPHFFARNWRYAPLLAGHERHVFDSK